MFLKYDFANASEPNLNDSNQGRMMTIREPIVIFWNTGLKVSRLTGLVNMFGEQPAEV